MGSYLGRHAELYDVFYADKPYDKESAFVHDCLQRYGSRQVRRLLELACGTGSHALELEKFGYEIVATDYSTDMVAAARRKGEQTGANVKFQEQDMTSLKVAGAPFDAAICLFDSIGYVQTNEALSQVFEGVKKHLAAGGLFIFEFWHAAAIISSYEPVRVRRWSVPGGEILRISETTLLTERQLCSVAYSIYELCADGTFSSLQETQMNRYFLLQEMSGWLTAHGFTPLKWFSGFSEDRNITEDTWHIVAVARRE
jgi:SAM-dependent methyltransferase